MFDQFVDAGIGQGREAEQPGIVAEANGACGLRERLPLCAADAGDPNHFPAASLLRRECEDGLVEAMLAYGELGGVDADCNPSRAGVEIVPGERALAALIELACRRQRQR